MQTPQQLKTLGICWLAVGATFCAIASAGQPAWLGLGLAFIVLGIVFLAKARKGDRE